ncbi:hypothetical protein ACIRF8_25490 [Streptomyces sp. NPDC102406]|uniref:hypothetical protein n=1 Tax=Streptomyces sp. NPDC102406 TaxID=3366171 RepID=UPI00380511DB
MAAGKSADFNGDGYGDLGISANGHAVVMYGTKTGLSGSRHQVLTDASASADRYSEFGDLMTGDDRRGPGRRRI